MANIEQFKIPEMSAYDKKDAEEYWSEYEAFENEEKSKGSDVEVSGKEGYNKIPSSAKVYGRGDLLRTYQAVGYLLRYSVTFFSMRAAMSSVVSRTNFSPVMCS